MIKNIADPTFVASDRPPGAILSNLDVQQAISAAMANTFSECVLRFGAIQLDATKAAIAESIGAAREILCAANTPAPYAPLQHGLAAEPGNCRSLPDAANEEIAVRGAPLAATVQNAADSERCLRELGVRQERAAEEERKRIARELHDDMGSLLASVKAYISVAQTHIESAGLPKESALDTAAELIDGAVEIVRRVIVDLRPSVLDQLGVWAALEWYADRINRQGSLVCGIRVDAEAAATQLDSERSTAVYRIVQEAVTNAVRHSGARHAEVRATRRGKQIQVEIEDDGQGICLEPVRESFGIAGMRERALAIGSELTIASEVNKGTCVTLRMPLNPARRE